ncbi:HMA2 domain-containing protein [Treponema zioleckii]|uniref:HMA2 domain-containing protein n=1 Tax=Treponema zioleckii TaxID=331680 RepID=UPI00168A42B2|nr:hypothetical protein [Treponema zioleckii]
MNISSFFPGRIRLRDAVLKDAEISAALRSAIEWHEAVKNIEHNLQTGSVLIEYTPSKLPIEKLTALQSELLELKGLCDRYNGNNRQPIFNKISELKERLQS